MNDSIIFKTDRLIIRKFTSADSEDFFDMMSNPKVMHPIPQNTLTKKESGEKLTELVSLYKIKTEKKIWAIDLKSNMEMIGLCGLIVNDEHDKEIAYRFREKFWNHGYGTEIAQGLIRYAFEKLNFKLITADVYTSNQRSIKIIEKYMSFDKEFYNETDNCIDRRYKLYKKDWKQANLS